MLKSLKFVLTLSMMMLGVTLSASAQDVNAGAKVFKKCAACHTVGDGAKHKIGPQLNDVFGRIAGSFKDYKYSKAMRTAGENGLVWDEATIAELLTKPKALVKGTKMSFAGLKKEVDRANIIAFLKTFSGEAESQQAPVEEKAKADAADTVKMAAAPAMLAKDAMVPEHGVFHLGREALSEEIAAWDIDIRPDGLGLPAGRGTVAQGEPIYIENCAVCHGDFGEGKDRWPVLAGGHDSLREERPEKTIGSYWPYLSTVFDYVRRAMPFGNARSLTDDDVYALTAYLLFLNDVVTDEGFELSKDNFSEIRLPNEANFIPDNRVEEPQYATKSEPCMSNCKSGTAQVTMRARVLDVTPKGDDSKGAGAVE